MLNGTLKLAVQKKGRLTDKSLQLLRNCGLDIDNYSDRLFVNARNFSLDVLFLRDDDIPEYVQDNVADIGIVGENVVVEKKADVRIEKKLGFGRCSLMIALRDGAELSTPQQLNGIKIATSYPVILKHYLESHNVDSKIITISGSVEIAPSLGVADAICDIVSTGQTLRLHKLKPAFSVFDSEAVLIANNNIKQYPAKFELLQRLLRRIDSVLNARDSRYLMMNIPAEAENEITGIVPALKSPTIVPLADKNALALHAVIPNDTFWEIIDDLKAAGATDILLLSIENMIL